MKMEPVKDVDVLPRRPVQLESPTERVQIERTVAVKKTEIEPVKSEQIEIERQELVRPDDQVVPIELAVVDAKSTPAQTELTPTEPAPPIDSTPIPMELRRATSARLDSTNVDLPVPTEQVSSVETKEIATPAAQNIELERPESMVAPTIAQPEPLKLARASDRAPEPFAGESLVPLIAEDSERGAPVSRLPTSPLKRKRASKSNVDSNSTIATENIKLIASNGQPGQEHAEPKVDVDRKEKVQASIPINALVMHRNIATLPTKSGGMFTPTPLTAASIAREANANAEGPLLKRISSRSPVYADTRVNLQSLLIRRNLDEGTKIEVVKEFGGTDETIVAIRRGLAWIEQHQHRDGHWSIHEFHKLCEGHKRCDGRGSSRSDTAGTGLALLPFLGDGNTHKNGPYKDNVARGINWLIKKQNKDGNFFTGGASNAFMYSHGIATIALCECYGMTNDASLRDSCQRAIDFIVAAQDPKAGGWRYKPRQGGDTSVVGWQVMALKSAQMAGLNVPDKTLAEAHRWLESVAGDKKRKGQFAYQRNNKFNPAMTAEALLCLEYMDKQRDSIPITDGAEFLLKNLPKKKRETSYYWYYGTQAMFHLQGEHWKNWNAAMHPLLIESQRKDGPMAGTWDPHDQWERGGGRIYSTALRVLILEVYYRHLPIYQVIE